MKMRNSFFLSVAVCMAVCCILLKGEGMAKNISFEIPVDFDMNQSLLGDEDLGIHLDRYPKGTYGESWFAWLYCDDGRAFFIMFSLSRLGKLGSNLRVDATYYDPQGNCHKSNQSFKLEDLKAYKTKVMMGHNYIQKTNEVYYWYIKDVDFELKFNLNNLSPAIMPGKGTLNFENDEFWTLSLVNTGAKLNGVLRFKGEKVDIDGYAYVDHVWCTAMPPSFLRSWYRFRVMNQDVAVFINDMHFKEKFSSDDARLMQVRLGNKNIILSNRFHKDYELANFGEREYKYPRRAIITDIRDEYEIRIQFTQRRVLGELDMLELFPGVIRWAVKTFFTKLWAFRFVYDFELSLECEGESYQFSGTCPGDHQFYY